MKYLCYFMLLFLGINTLNAQFGPQQIISSTTDGAYLSIPFDIDNDGHMDVLKSGVEQYQLAWHRNINGEGIFGPENLVSDSPALYLSMDFVDLDSDGDKDLVYIRNNPRTIEWLENLNGLGNFGPLEVLVPAQSTYVNKVNIVDVDNDGDLDLIVTRLETLFVTYDIFWLENDGQANFASEELLLDNIDEGHPPILVDLDNDGNLDMLMANENQGGPAKLVWHRNLGNVQFDTETLIYQFTFLPSDWTSITNIQYVDINTDNKDDIVITSHHDDLGTFYHWFENLDNLGAFGPIQSLPRTGQFVDLDNDGDLDILTGQFLADRIFWIENTDGLGAFTIERTISTEVDFLRDVAAADFNEDGLMDVVSASISDDKVAWYENTGVLGIEDTASKTFSIFPNPTHGRVLINTENSIQTVHVFDGLGNILKTVHHSNEIDLSAMNSGLYFIQIEDTNGSTEIKKILKL